MALGKREMQTKALILFICLFIYFKCCAQQYTEYFLELGKLLKCLKIAQKPENCSNPAWSL